MMPSGNMDAHASGLASISHTAFDEVNMSVFAIRNVVADDIFMIYFL
tara:strand:- start:209 stop:349 length:141 start_codon:yes stop_codon:yes gene_type:complete